MGTRSLGAIGGGRGCVTSGVAIYARYSSDRQSERSIDGQIALCREWITRDGVDPSTAMVFTDYAISAASLARPGLDALLSQVRAGAIRCIVAESLDRVSRDEADMHTLLREMAYLDVRLVGASDGTDTSREGASILIGVRATMSADYLRDLRKKTLRGMRDRASAGMATGGLPFGYRSREVSGGRAIEIDPDAARIVVRIYEEYAAGRSRAQIATRLNADDIPPPRSSRRVRAASWQETTIRNVLANERYTGVWTFGEREWRKVPGTNIRRPRMRDPRDVIRLEREDLRVISRSLWDAVRGRSDGERRALTPRERQGGGRRAYLLSGLLRCGACGGLMQIHGGAVGRGYYRCTESRSRGTCANRMSVREEVIRRAILDAIAVRLAGAEAMARVRAICERVIARRTSASSREAAERRKRAERADLRARRLVEALARGSAPASVMDAIRAAEAEAVRERSVAADLERAVAATAALPSPDELVARVLDVARVVERADVTIARERLRALLRGGAITMEPRADRTYLVRSAIVPAMLLASRGVVGIAGALSTDDATEIPLEITVEAA